MGPVHNPHRSEAHRTASLARVAHHELAGAPASGTLFRALGGAFPDATALYLVGAQFTPAIRQALTPHAEWIGTVVPAGTGWAHDWYETTRLRVDAWLFATLASFADVAGAPAVGTTGALFRHDDLLAEWITDAGAPTVGLLEVTATIPPARLGRLARALSATATFVAPAV